MDDSAAQSQIKDTVKHSVVDRILQRTRKARQPKACYPCRRRKVRCSGIPCSHCAARGHPELCSMNPEDLSFSKSSEDESNTSPLSEPNQVKSNLNIQFPDNDNLPITRTSTWRSTRRSLLVENTSCTLPQYALPPLLHRSPSNDSETSPPEQGHGISNMGNPFPAATRNMRDRNLDKRWVQRIYDNIGLQDSPMAYPFENLWSPLKTAEGLCLALPSNAHIQRYHQIFREIMLPVYPGLVDIDSFESELQNFLDNRDKIVADADNTHFDASWLSLLFAVLACGAQCLGSTDKEAELNSKVFISISFQFLRLVNFLINPNVDIIQSLLLIGSCIRNDMNPAITWSILGVTIRLAQMIGCHERQTFYDADGTPNVQAITKSKLWWAVVWQDSFLALCYNQPPGTTSVRVPFPPESGPSGQYTYMDVLSHVCDVIQDFCRQRTLLDEDVALPYSVILDLANRVQEIPHKAQPHLQAFENCINLQQYSEYLVTRIYVNHATSQLFLSVLRSSSPNEIHREKLVSLTSDGCVAVLEAYLKLRQVSVLTSHYWSLLHCAVKSTEYLASWRRDDPTTTALAKRFVRSLECSCDDNVNTKSSFSTTLSQIIKDLKALLG